MLILFDHGTPRGLAGAIAAHEVKTAREMGWERLSNGDLLRSAEDTGFDLLLTTDQRIRYQQNLTGRSIAILVIRGSSKWSRVCQNCGEIAAAVESLLPGSYSEGYIAFNEEKSRSKQ